MKIKYSDYTAKEVPTNEEIYRRIGELCEEIADKDRTIKNQDLMIEQMEAQLEAFRQELKKMYSEALWTEQKAKEQLAEEVANSLILDILNIN